MDAELEVKFYPVDKEKLRGMLKQAGGKLVIAERLMRRVIYDEMFHPEFKCDFLRIRDEGNKLTFAAKTHSKTGKIEDELEVEVRIDDYDKTIQILAAAGLSPDKYQETLRESWEIDGCKVDIDTWPGLQTYCEIESDTEAKIKVTAEKLGFDWSKHWVTNAMDIYVKVYGLTVKEVIEMAAKLTFENNPFAKLTPKL